MLAAAFLFFHRLDLARAIDAWRALAAFVHARGLARGLALAESAAALVVAALVVLAWYGAGAGLLRIVHRRWPSARPHVVATACAIGALVWSLVWFVLGLAGAYRTAPALVALAIGVSLAVAATTRRSARGAVAEVTPSLAIDTSVIAPAAMIAIAVAVAALAALAPPTAKDSLQYHLALPKAFLVASRLVEVSGNIASYYPLAVESNGMWAMLIGRALSARAGEAAFGAITFAFLPLLLAFVYGWTTEMGVSRGWAATAAALIATAPVVYDVAASAGYVDLALALYVAIATRAAVRWWATGERAELAVFALAAGGALGVKMTAIFAVIALALVALLGARRARGGFGGVVGALVVALVLGAPWYVRTWWLTGSPFFPFFLDLWPGAAPGWDVERSMMYRAFNGIYGGDKDVLGYLVLPFRLALMGQREVAAFYESAVGVTFLVAVPVIAWAAWRRRLDGQAFITAVIAVALFVWWTTTGQVARYLMPVVPLLAVVGAHAASALAGETDMGRWVRATLLVPAAAGLAVLLAWFLADAPMLSVLGVEPRAEYLSRRLDYYPYYRVINDEIPRAARIWLIDVRRDTYHLERAYSGDYLFEDYTLRRTLAGGKDAEALRRAARADGITHVFIRHDTLFDYARSPLVDDRLPQSENAARLARLRDFLLEGTTVIRGDQKFLLVALERR